MGPSSSETGKLAQHECAPAFSPKEIGEGHFRATKAGFNLIKHRD
jgi:hypothetical protein